MAIKIKDRNEAIFYDDWFFVWATKSIKSLIDNETTANDMATTAVGNC